MNVRVARWAALGFGLSVISGTAYAQPTPAPPLVLPGTPSVQVGTVEVRDIAAGPLVIGRGVFSGLRHEGEIVRAERVRLENVVGVAGERRIAIPEIVASEVSLPAELFRALTQGTANPLDGPAMLARVSARDIRIPALADEDGAAFTKTAYVNILLGDVKDGVMASGRIDTVVVAAGDGGGGDAASMKTGAVAWRSVDLAEMLRFSTGGKRGGDDGGAKRLIESATVEGITLSASGVEVAVARIELAGFRGRAPESSLDTSPPAPRIVPPGMLDPTVAGLARYAAEALNHAQVDRYSIEGVRVRAPDLGALSIARVLIAGLSARGLERFAIEGVEIGEAGMNLKLASFAIEKLNYSKLADIFLKAVAAGREPDLAMSQISEAAPKIGAIRLRGLALDTPAGPFSLAEATIDVDDPDADMPERLTLKIAGLKADLQSAPPGAGHETLLELGYRHVSADARMQVRWAPRERALLLEETWIAVADAGRMDLAVRLGNVDLTPASANPEIAEQIMEAAHIESVEFRLADAGFADRFFAQVARQAGVSDAEARATLALDLKTQAVELFGTALAPGAPEALEAFLRKPSRLIVRVTPKQGQPPLAMGDLEQLSAPELNARIAIAIENAAP